MISSRMFTSCTAPLVTRINVGMLPCRSSRVCILTAALRWRNLAHGNNDKHSAHTVGPDRTAPLNLNALRLHYRTSERGSPVAAHHATRIRARLDGHAPGRRHAATAGPPHPEPAGARGLAGHHYPAGAHVAVRRRTDRLGQAGLQ